MFLRANIGRGFYCFGFLRCALWPKNVIYLDGVPCEPEKKCIVLLLDEAEVCIYQLYPVDWCVEFSYVPYWFSACWIHFWEVLMSPTMIVDSTISLWISIDYCLTLDTLILSPYQGLLYLLEEFSLYCIIHWNLLIILLALK